MTQGVQTSYEDKMEKGYPGQILDLEPKLIRSGFCKVASPGDTIPFGRVVTRSGEGVKLGETDPAFGLSVRDLARENDADGNAAYAEGETVGFMQVGFMYCEIDGTGSAGDALTYIDGTGQLSTAAADASHTALNAILEEDCATTGDLCKVRINILANL